MHTWIQRRLTRPSTCVLGALLAMGIVWIGALHYSPTAHEHVHDDAHDEDHYCVVEVFADGLVSEMAKLHVAMATEVISTEIPVRREFWWKETDYLRPPGRAPPLG